MIRILCSLIILLSLTTVPVFGQELFVRNDKHFTELYLKLDIKDIGAVEKHDDSVDIYFIKTIKKPFSKTFDDMFLGSLSVSNNIFTVRMKPDVEFSVVNDVAGIKIMATKKKTNSDILSSYGIGKPMLSGDSGVAEDRAQEDALNRADGLIASKRFSEGAAELNDIIKTSKNDFYRQEAFYKLGQTYLLMAQYNDEYLINAYQTFDDFVKLYPDNFRAADALIKSAESKVQANQLFEAIFTYQKIYDSVSDLDTKRQALISMAELYKTVGQLEKAVIVYQDYLNRFKTDSDEINGNIGQIFYDRKEMDIAYEYFSIISIDKLLADKSVDIKRLFSIAKNMEYKKKYDNALKLYNAIYERYPDAPQANDAIFSSAAIYEKTGRTDEADALLLKLKQMFPEKITGQQATIEYAEKYINTKPYAYWKDFFKDLLSRPDDFGLHEKARYLLLKTMHRENNREGTIDGVAEFLSDYPASAYRDELNKMREDFMFARASGIFGSGDYKTAEPLLLQFKLEYPATPYIARTNSMLLDIKFGKVQDNYNNGKYKSAITEAENHITNMPESKELARWFNLLDDSYYRDLAITYSSDDYPATRVGARHYLTSFPSGRHVKAVTNMLEQAMTKSFETAYAKTDFPGVVRLYEANGDWISTWNNRTFRDNIATLSGLAAYKLGSRSKAQALYSSVTPNKTTNYAILGLVLGDKNADFDVNGFDQDTFRYVAGEVEQMDQEAAISLIKKYTKDLKLSAGMEYAIAKNMAGDARRQELLMDVYDKVSSNPSARFEGSDDVHLDIGLLYYRKNDFKSAVVPLKQYTDLHKDKDDKRAEALYYLGKSFVGMNDKDRGYQYYNEIIQTMPDSIYAGIAKSELDEDSWKKNLNRF